MLFWISLGRVSRRLERSMAVLRMSHCDHFKHPRMRWHDPGLGMKEGREGKLNQEDSLKTRQAGSLLEVHIRSPSCRFPNYKKLLQGTSGCDGMVRREA